MANVTTVQTIVALQATATPAGAVTQLSKAGREGNFIWKTGNFTAQAASDPLMGIYVPSTVTAITSGCWVREWDGITGRPEWFGAVVNDSSGSVPANNLSAIQACFALCPVTLFGAADYYVNGTVIFNVSFRTAKGETAAWDSTGKGARIVSTNSAADVVNVGAAGGGATDMLLEGICAVHNVKPTAPSAGLESTAAKSWVFLSTTSVTIRRLSAFDPLIGFYFNGNVALYANDCRAFGPDIYGFWAHDHGSHPGLAGGNGSLYLERCNVTGGAIGFYANADFADVFLDKAETSGTAIGILLDGSGSTYNGGQGDTRITNATIDQAATCGIEVKNTNSLAKIQILGGYIQLQDNGGSHRALWFHDGGGYLTVTGAQVTGNDSATTSCGVWIENYPNVVLDHSTIVENFAYPFTVLNSARPTILCHIQAGANNSAGTRAALTMANCGEGVISPVISGGSNAFITGLNFDSAGNTRITADLTRVDLGALGAGGKLTINGAGIASPGYYKTNGTSGAASDNGVYVTGFPG